MLTIGPHPMVEQGNRKNCPNPTRIDEGEDDKDDAKDSDDEDE